VSITTVSRVLSPGSHPVRAETAQRVREGAAALDFGPSALASGLASRHTGLLGFVVKDLGDPHYPQIASGAEEVARAHNLALLVCNTLGDSRRLAEYLRVLRARRVEAVVVSGGSSLSPGEIAALRATGLVFVLIGRPADGQAVPYVTVDNQGAARTATLHLADSGRRRIVHLAGPETQTTMADRATGYRAALAERNLPVEVISTDGTPESGARAVTQLLQSPSETRPDSLFTATDRLAFAALGTATDLGIQVPSDLALVGFDDTPLAELIRPALTSVAQPARELGEAAIRLAQQLLGGQEWAPVTLAARLVVRASSAPAS
jgi:LacI family transcriptional regulator